MALQPAKQPRSTIVVELDRRYKPGSGPPLQPITLVPRRGSTAYIISKMVMTVGKELSVNYQRQMYYLIGWKDLPAAQMTIAATKILDYVSPAELEDWEYKELLRKEAEQEKQKEDIAKGIRPSKRMGRQRKWPLKARLPEAQVDTTPELSASEEARIARKNASAPSLSTPKKRTLQELLAEDGRVEETGEEDDSDEAAIARQLRVETGAELTGEDGQEEDSGPDVDMPDISRVVVKAERASKMRKSSPLETSSRSSSLIPSIAPLSISAPEAKEEERKEKSMPRVPAPAKRKKKALSTAATILSSAAPAAPRPRTTGPKEAVVPPPNVPPAPMKIHPMFAKAMGASPSSVGTSAAHPGFFGQSNGSSNGAASQSSQIHPTLLRQPQAKADRSQPGTPAPKSGETVNGASTATGQQAKGFTPANATPHKKAPASRSTTPAPASRSQAPKSSTKKKKPRQRAPEMGEEDWEVKELLDERRRYNQDNKLVHEFKVLWAGDWPQDQNPSWEPERNISDALIKEFRQKMAARGKVQRSMLSYMPPRLFANVADAFAGDIDEEGAKEDEASLHNGHGSEESEKEELFVTSDTLPPSSSTQKTRTPSFSRFDGSATPYHEAFNTKPLGGF